LAQAQARAKGSPIFTGSFFVTADDFLSAALEGFEFFEAAGPV
jgi:hypothetical protein